MEMSFIGITKKGFYGILVSLVVMFGLMLSMPKVSAAVDCTGLSGTEASKCQACKASGGDNTVYAGGECTDGTNSAETNVTQLVADIINVFSWIVGVASVIMIMVGGFKYITSQGDSGNITSAKNTILYAIIGLVIVMFAQIIVRFVINKV